MKSLGFFPGLNLENQSFWAKISLLTTSILVTVVTLVFSVASSNLFSVYMYISSLSLSVMLIPIVAVLPFFGVFGRKSVLSASLASMMSALILVCLRNYSAFKFVEF